MTDNTTTDSKTRDLLLDIWRDILEKIDIDPYATFLDLGGQSLLGVRISNHIRNQFGVDIPLWFLFSDEGSIDTIARLIDEERNHQ